MRQQLLYDIIINEYSAVLFNYHLKKNVGLQQYESQYSLPYQISRESDIYIVECDISWSDVMEVSHEFE